MLDVSVPRVLGDDFALRRGHAYATVLIDAEAGERVDVLAGRKAEVLEAGCASTRAPGSYADAGGPLP
ncbi:MAG TPA: hypothetical protein DEH11_08735 [Actinobacteria bacterium]|nr:hypothetical protein [Actinomycetota bacterium]